MSDEDLEHVARPLLPWRDEKLTECGLAQQPGRRIITRAMFEAKVKRQGKTRSAMTTCITCWQAAARWKDWATSPSEVMRRELPSWHDRDPAQRLDSELRAIEALIDAHRDEFDDFLAGLADTADLSAQRAARRRRIVGDRRWTL